MVIMRETTVIDGDGGLLTLQIIRGRGRVMVNNEVRVISN